MNSLCLLLYMYINVFFSIICAFSVAWSCPTLCDPMDCSPQGSSVHGILLARILEWVAMSSSRGPSPSRDWTHVCFGRNVPYHRATGVALNIVQNNPLKIIEISIIVRINIGFEFYCRNKWRPQIAEKHNKRVNHHHLPLAETWDGWKTEKPKVRTRDGLTGTVRGGCWLEEAEAGLKKSKASKWLVRLSLVGPQLESGTKIPGAGGYLTQLFIAFA